jgi:signal transduction histidine kinase
MNFSAVASLINFLGFAFGIALYAVLLVMVVRHRIRASANEETGKLKFTPNWLLFATAILGLLWNFGNLTELAWRDYWSGRASPFLTGAAYAALGFLPAVVVHSEWLATTKIGKDFKTKLLTIAAYVLSGIAAILHFRAAAVLDFAPSVFALQILTVGYLAILASLFLATRQSGWQKSVRTAALAVFAVSALHLSQPHDRSSSIFIELLGHQASLPLAFAILYQDYRFAFADLFLKRALSFLFLTAFVLVIYLILVAPLLAMHENHPPPDPQRIAVMIGFGMTSAFAYPKLHQSAVWFVDRVLLRRVPYDRLQTEIMQKISTLEPIESVLNEVKDKLAAALTAKTAFFREIYQKPDSAAATTAPLVGVASNSAEVMIPTADEPHFQIILPDLAGGRRLLSEEIEMLESVALHTARRIDQLRVTHERCERELREQEFSKLATEAELRVLRAQINPHFLFNALTTIGYLINTAPHRAVQTLVQLTGLLRGSLRSTGEFQTLGDELKLIKAYLEIEKARFEERLQVDIDVPEEFASFRIPSLILQPLVENAVKHGISPQKKGGAVRIKARRENGFFILQVADTGAGIGADELRLKRESRVGLNNVEQRLHLYYNGAANLTIESGAGGGTNVEIRFDTNAPQSAHQIYKTTAVNKSTERAFL